MKAILALFIGLFFAFSAFAGLNDEEEQQLTIISASYGAADDRIDVAENLRPLIAHGCLLLRGKWNLGERNPAPDTVKEVQIVYIVNGKRNSVEFTQDQDIILAPTKPGFFIINATYGSDNRRVDVTEAIRASVAENSLHLMSQWEFCGIDPAFGIVKTVEITYLDAGVLKTGTFDQEHEINLP